MLARYLIVVALAAGFSASTLAADPPPTNTTFVIINKTGFNSSQIYVKFLGAPINTSATPQTYGKNKSLKLDADTPTMSYSLKDMLAPVPNSPYSKQLVPTFSINSYAGGRIYFSFGDPLAAGTPTNPIPNAGNSMDPDYETLYQYVEPFVSGVGGATNNMDLSYVDFVGMPIDIAVRTSSGAYYPYPNGVNPQTTQTGRALVSALQKTDVPQVAYVRDTNKKVLRVVSPSIEPAGYHTWDSLLGYLHTRVTQGKPVKIESYTTQQAFPQLPANTLFGYTGRDDIPSDVYSQAFWPRQSYSFTADYLTNLNPGGANTRINIPDGTPGILLTGSTQPAETSGPAAGAFDIYITEAELSARTGIWGNNPAYVIDWTSKPGGAEAYHTLGIENDVTGRIVGDLLAGILFGWAGDNTNLAVHAAATQTKVPAELTAQQVGDLSTGEYFFLLSTQPDGKALGEWWGAGISNNPDYYSSYGTALTELTTAYTSAFGDRLQGPLTPSLYWAVNDIAPQGLYIEITLNPGAYDSVSFGKPFGQLGIFGLTETYASSGLYDFLTRQSQQFTDYVKVNRTKVRRKTF